MVFIIDGLFSVLWRQENAMQQQIGSVRDELNKKEQALRSITGKVRNMSRVRSIVH